MNEVRLYYTEEDVECTRRARALRAALRRDGWDVRLVNRLSNKLDDLLLCAAEHIVRLPRWQVYINGKLWYDEHAMPSYNEAQKVLNDASEA